MSRADTARQHGHLLRELNEERAAALLRISRKLQSLIDELNVIRARMADATSADVVQDRADYRALRAEALRYRWYLEVQREALGLRRHEALDEFYPIPAPSPE